MNLRRRKRAGDKGLMPESTRDRIAKAMTGKSHSEETKKKIGQGRHEAYVRDAKGPPTNDNSQSPPNLANENDESSKDYPNVAASAFSFVKASTSKAFTLQASTNVCSLKMSKVNLLKHKLETLSDQLKKALSERKEETANQLKALIERTKDILEKAKAIAHKCEQQASQFAKEYKHGIQNPQHRYSHRMAASSLVLDAEIAKLQIEASTLEADIHHALQRKGN